MNAHDEVCSQWWREFQEWKTGFRHTLTRPKPPGFDQWMQGYDPLQLALTKPICCHGGGLVPDTWTPSALPVTPAGELMTQPTLL